MTEKLEKLELLKKKLVSLRPLTEGEIDKLNENFMIEYTYDSNAIEGSTLTLDETALVLKENVTIEEKPLNYHLDAIGHKEAFYYLLDLIKEKKNLSENEILNIHSLVLMSRVQDKGKYRSIPVTIVGSDVLLEQPYMIKPSMERLIEEYNKLELSLIEKISLFHLKFERIHPFIDGNGRTGRLIINFELMKNGLLPINIKSLDKIKYYDAFKKYDKEEDSSLMTNLILDYEILELEKYICLLEE